MAAHSHTRAGSRTSLGAGEQELPSGSCNYRDLSIGASAYTCGCARFWLNTSHHTAIDGPPERAWCFCGHHACFHNASSQQEETEHVPSGSRPVNIPPALNNAKNDTAASGSRYLTPPKPLAGLGIRADSRPQTQSINTRKFQALNDFARQQEDGSEAGMGAPSHLPSTAAPSIVEEPLMSPNRLIRERLEHYRAMAPPVQIPTVQAERPAEDYSATEVATPSIAGTPDFRALASSSTGTGPSPGHLYPSRLEPRQQRPEPTAAAGGETTHVRQPARPLTAPAVTLHSVDVQNILQAYGRRLDVLESLSFSQVPVEELQERFEHFDGRILDLEHWRTDHEDTHPTPDPARSKSRRILPNETSSFEWDGSFDLEAAAHVEAAVLATLAANAETHPRINALEQRVEDLENAALPSYARPWHVQVVLLPWGRDLKGIWFSANEAVQHSMRGGTQTSEEWTGAQSGPRVSFKSTSGAAWTTESIQAWASQAQEWLSPKACGPTGTVFRRLASRGLVKDVVLTASDARHVLNSISTAFEDVREALSPEDEALQADNNHQGLREPFIPLRKIRKSARLRFLSPAEMVTSATWDASFLDSSVFMRTNEGQRRLYMTTSDAYLQPSTEAWSWRRIRDLPLAEASPHEQVIQTEKLAIEACWTYNDRFDRNVSLHSSFASHESQWSIRSQVAAEDEVVIEDRPISPQSELRPQRQRTVSLPESGSANDIISESLPKRRVASFEPKSTTSTDEPVAENHSKRRRISMSPEAERRGVNFTPRWSREPASPFTSEALVESRSQGAASGSRRQGTTPFAYATPHSNSNFVGRMEIDSGGGDGDTEVATDIIGGHSERGAEDGEEWEGVEDGNVDEQDMKPGLTMDEV